MNKNITRILQRCGKSTGDYFRMKAFLREYGEPDMIDDCYMFYVLQDKIICFSNYNYKWLDVTESQRQEDKYFMKYRDSNFGLYLNKEASEKLKSIVIERILIGEHE